MKKYISLLVCFVLIVFAFITSTPTKMENIAGEGNGENSRVSNAEQLVDVLEFFGSYEIKDVDEQNNQFENKGFSLFGNNISEEDEYTSVTFYNKSKGASNYRYSKDGVSLNNKVSFMRELTVNFTQTAALYHSVGEMMNYESFVNKDNEQNFNSFVYNFDIEIYITTKVCYIKFNKFDITGLEGDNSVPNVPIDALNMWLNASVGAEDLLELNKENLDILDSIHDYFKEYKFSRFNQTNKVYSIGKDYLVEAFSIIFNTSFPEKVRGDFSVNLANETRPKINIVQSYTGDNYSHQYVENNIVFSYINNTVIDVSKMPTDPPMLEEYLK